MNKTDSFRDYIKNEVDSFLEIQQNELGIDDNTLKIDLHCHDKNSNLPSERLGRILGIPETWLKTKDLLSCLDMNKTSALTITNHNNARSCWNLLDKGYDILPAAEFTCILPDSEFSIHVLTYGFTPEQEARLQVLRANLYHFLAYCREQDLLTVWAHPLYFNHNNFSQKAVEDLEHLATLFSHFEVINGQRNSWQNLITIKWLKSFDQEKIERISRRNGVNIRDLCSHPYENFMVGGSDDHMGLFAGSSGTYVKIDNLPDRLKTATKSQLILEGLKGGRVAPYGFYTEENKMSITFLELFYMIVNYMDDPGLIRMLLHQGDKSEKMLGFLITNGIGELRRHKFTLQFLKTFHNALHGKGPDFWTQAFIKKSARPMLQEIETIAKSRSLETNLYVAQTKKSIKSIYSQLSTQAMAKAAENIMEMNRESQLDQLKLQDLLEKIELPASIRTIFGDADPFISQEGEKKNNLNMGRLFDRLPFPVLASSIIAGVNFTSTKVLHDNRHFLNHFARENEIRTAPGRMLWLTDTFVDKNGIAISLNNYREEVCKRDLPIDFLVCHETLDPDDHLIVTKPIGTFPIPMYKEQSIRIPNIMDIHDIFRDGNYDRIICSTELMMGAVGLYLKKCFNVEAYFFLHTDWLEFAQTTLELSTQIVHRLMRFSREFYQQFDKLFVLNSDHAQWLAGPKMNIKAENISLIKHWVNPDFTVKKEASGKRYINKRVNEKILLFVGRLSEEKGIFDFPYIVDKVKKTVGPCKVVFVGRGPAKDKLVTLMPEAIFLDWIEQEELPQIYNMADFLIFPSRFDTFGRVVLEALSCGCPVAAYNEKGPKDIIEDGISGVLREDKQGLAEELCRILSDDDLFQSMKGEAVNRSSLFGKENILGHFLEQTGLITMENPVSPIPARV
jgi:glycosyltransferase involved in cell wall biosynthesis